MANSSPLPLTPHTVLVSCMSCQLDIRADRPLSLLQRQICGFLRRACCRAIHLLASSKRSSHSLPLAMTRSLPVNILSATFQSPLLRGAGDKSASRRSRHSTGYPQRSEWARLTGARRTSVGRDLVDADVPTLVQRMLQHLRHGCARSGLPEPGGRPALLRQAEPQLPSAPGHSRPGPGLQWLPRRGLARGRGPGGHRACSGECSCRRMSHAAGLGGSTSTSCGGTSY